VLFTVKERGNLLIFNSPHYQSNFKELALYNGLHKLNKEITMGKYIELTSSDFESTLSEGVSLVDFWAPWCGPCRMIAPVIEELANDYDGKAKICKVNTDEEQDIAVKFGIRSIPTIMFFKDGKMVDQVVGAQSKAALAQKIDALLA
jgi:thioredoxin 1